MVRVISASIGFCLITTTVLAQTPDLRGQWVTKTAPCDDLIITITAQAPNGVIEGTQNCTKQPIKVPFGEQIIRGKQMSGKFDGTNVNIESSTGSYTRLKLESGKLVGSTSSPARE